MKPPQDAGRASWEWALCFQEDADLHRPVEPCKVRQSQTSLCQPSGLLSVPVTKPSALACLSLLRRWRWGRGTLFHRCCSARFLPCCAARVTSPLRTSQ